MTTKKLNPFETAVWQVLRGTYLRLLSGGREKGMDVSEQNLLLDPHIRALEHDFTMLMEVVSQGQSAGISHVHTLLHNSEGVDNEMLDQTVEYAALSMQEQEDQS